ERGIRRERRTRKARRDPLGLLAALGERTFVDRRAVPQKDVERDVARRRLGRELSDSRLGWVQAHLHGVELEPAVELDDDLTVERGMRREEIAEFSQLGEVAKQ